jgi:hypothetical protein
MGDRERLIGIAKRYIGVTEKPLGSNRGQTIDAWNLAVGAPVGSFWCASFVSAVVREFNWSSDDDFPFPLSASCDDWLRNAKKRDLLFDHPAVGAIGLVINPTNHNDATHIFIVDGYENGKYSSIEGNSNSGGSRNGTTVARRVDCQAGRPKTAFIHWFEGDDPEIPWHLVITVDAQPISIQLETIGNSTYLPVRYTLQTVGLDTTLLTYQGMPMYAGQTLKDTVVIKGKTHMKVRTFCEKFSLKFTVNSAAKVINVTDEKTSWV